MPSHVIYDALWSSRKLPKCSKLAALAYPWIYLVADDWGRFEDLPRVIWGRAFGSREDITAKDVARWLDEYYEVGLLVRYQARGARFCAWTRFRGRKKSKRRVSELPPPPPELWPLIDTKEDESDSGSDEGRDPTQLGRLEQEAEQEAGGRAGSRAGARAAAGGRGSTPTGPTAAAALIAEASVFAARTGRQLEGTGGVLEEATRTPKGKALTTEAAVLACRREEWLSVSIDTLRSMSRRLPPPPVPRPAESQARVDLVRELRAHGTNGSKPKLWESAVAWIEPRLNPHSFGTWFHPTRTLGLLLDPPRLIVEVAGEAHRDWISKNYRELVEQALDAVQAAPELQLQLVTSEEVEAASKSPP